jgi:signal transduction histidine kinase
MRTAPSRIAYVLRWIEPEAIEVWFGFVAFIYGLWLVAPWPVYEFPQAASSEGPYALASQIWGTEEIGGTLAAILGLLSVVASTYRGLIRHRTWIQAALVLYWTVVVVSLVSWHWRSTGTPIYGSLSIIHAWAAYRLWKHRNGGGILLAHAVVERLPLPILFWTKREDGAFVLLHANHEAFKRINDPEFRLGVPWFQLSRDDHPDFNFDSGVRTVRNGPELVWCKRVWRRSAVTASHDFASFAEILVDVTDLADTMASLQRTNQDLEQFAYAASHDLQEPLRMIGAWTSSLFEDYGDRLQEKEALQMKEFITSGVFRMHALIRDLLTFSRAGRQLKMGRINLKQPVLDAMEMLQERIRVSGARIEFGELEAVFADSGMLALVFQNIISNSLKFAKDDEFPHIRIESKRVNGHVQVSVIDNGIGIDPKYQKQVFEVFRRLHSQDEYDGTGIGLALVRRIVHAHGGAVWVESKGHGFGTAIHFTVRARRHAHISE